MIHTGPVPGDYTSDWKRSDCVCHKCKTPGYVFFRVWELSCGGYEDIQYECRSCDKKWWVEGPDA